jgi:rhodanese-related sulfurtransferase
MPARGSPTGGRPYGTWPPPTPPPLDDWAGAYLGDRSRLDTISRGELLPRIGDRTVVVIDMRPEPEFRAGHIPGALPTPIDDLLRRVAELPADRPMVADCRGPFCVYADHAVRILGGRGIDAVRLQDGFPEWARAGLPVSAAGRPDPAAPPAGPMPSLAGRRGG